MIIAITQPIARRYAAISRTLSSSRIQNASALSFLPGADVSVYRAIRPAGPLDMPEEIEGACLESLVYQELTALNDQLGLGYELSSWRTSSGAEVDFVLYGKRGIISLEVKRTRRTSKADLASLPMIL